MTDTYDFLKAQKDAILAKREAEQHEWLQAALDDIEMYKRQLAEAQAENKQLAEFVVEVGGFWGNTKSVLVGGDSLAATINKCFEGYEAALAENKRLQTALNELCAWRDGDVGGHMDEPHAAMVARAALQAKS